MSQEYIENDLEIVSINSVCFNKNCSMLTAKLEMCIGNKQIGNTIQNRHRKLQKYNALVYIQKLFPRITECQLAKTTKIA